MPEIQAFLVVLVFLLMAATCPDGISDAIALAAAFLLLMLVGAIVDDRCREANEPEGGNTRQIPGSFQAK